MENANILIVEDEPKLARVLELELTYENYNTAIAHNGQDALQQMREEDWDLVLLDIMLPQLSGLEVLRRFRKKNTLTPVILLTARDQVHDKVSGLDLGANDYMTKPFQIEELLARIRAQLRYKRNAKSKKAVLSLGDLSIDIRSREVIREGKQISLTPREFELLVCLLKNRQQVLTREQLIEYVWGFDYVGDTNVVDVYIRYLRQKIDEPFSKPYIQTVRGVGYMIKEMQK